ncbi:hypothetical protein SLA2020_230280 [Shorea laevis]
MKSLEKVLLVGQHVDVPSTAVASFPFGTQLACLPSYSTLRLPQWCPCLQETRKKQVSDCPEKQVIDIQVLQYINVPGHHYHMVFQFGKFYNWSNKVVCCKFFNATC